MSQEPPLMFRVNNDPMPSAAQDALNTLKKMPGLNPYFVSVGGTSSVSLRPTCHFENEERAQKFGKELSDLCFKSLYSYSLTAQPLFSVSRRGDDQKPYTVEINLATTHRENEMSFASRRRLASCISAIKENAHAVGILLAENGIDMHEFHGFGRERA